MDVRAHQATMAKAHQLLGPPDEPLALPLPIKNFLGQHPAFPPVVIEGLLRQQEIILMGGAAKKWKSWARADMLYCVVNGFDWLGFHCHQGKAIHLDFECLEADIWERFELIHRSYCQDGLKGSLANIDYIALRGLEFPAAQLCSLPERIGSTAYSVFSFDPIYRLLLGKGENDQAAVCSLLTEFLSLGNKLGSAIALLQHFAKGDASEKDAQDRFSGSGVWARFPDALMTFTELQDENCFSVEFQLRSFEPLKPLAVRWQFPRFRIDSDLDPAHLKTKPSAGRPAKYESEMLCAILGDQNLPHNEFFRRTKTATGMSKRTFERCLQTAVSQHLIHNSPLGYGLTIDYITKNGH